MEAVQGWRLADLLRSVDLGGAIAEGLLDQVRQSVAAEGKPWHNSMELELTNILGDGGDCASVEALLAGLNLPALLAPTIACGIAAITTSTDEVGRAQSGREAVRTANEAAGGCRAPPSKHLDSRFVAAPVPGAAPPQLRVAFRVVHAQDAEVAREAWLEARLERRREKRRDRRGGSRRGERGGG